jgi:hypothetical protein
MKKIKNPLRIAIILLLITASGCSVSLNKNQVQSSLPTKGFSSEIKPSLTTTTDEQMAVETMTPIPTQTVSVPSQELARNKYEFEISVDYSAHKLQINQTITYQNQTGSDLLNIPIEFPPNHYENAIRLINYTSIPVSALTFPEKGLQVGQIEMAEPLDNGSNLRVNMNFIIDLPNQKAPFGYTNRQMNLVNWYPVIPPYKGNGEWYINEFSSIGEYLVAERSDYSAKITVNGTDNLKVACSGEIIVTVNELECANVNSRDLSLSISQDFQIITQDFINFKIKAYVFNEDAGKAQEIIRNTASALIYFEDLYDSKYPRSTISIVEADFPDGMESDGMYFLSQQYIQDYDETHRNYMTILSAHETAHQWFYGMVGNDPANEPWLDEAFCTLSEIMFFEEFYPADAEWWWSFRVDAYNPQGRVNSSVYEMDSVRSYINAVYLQGVRFLSKLRKVTGDEYFIEALRNYVHRNTNQIAATGDFFSEFTPFDISGLKTKYFSE